jgi:hypothetical protein
MKNLDRYCAVAAYILITIVACVLKVKEFHPIYIVACVIALVCITLYLIFRDKLVKDHEFIGYGDWFVIGVSVYLLIWAALAYAQRSDPYIKPLEYYLLAASSVGLLFFAAMFSDKKRYLYTILGLACVIGLMHIWTESMMFSGLIGIDPWSHLRVVTDELGRVTDWKEIGGYYSAVHFYLRWIMDVTGLDYRMAALIFLGSVQMVGNIIFSFLLGKELFNIKVGVVAALMLSCANWNITFGEWIIPNGIGATFALATAYLMIKQYKHHWTLFIVGGILALSYFTHMIAMVWVTGTIICFTVFPMLFAPQKSFKQVLIMMAKLSVVPIVLIGLVIAWFTFTTNGNSLYATAGQSSFNPAFGMSYAIGQAPTYIGEAVNVVVQNSLNYFNEMVINSAGFLLFIGIALIGILMMLRRDRFNKTYAILCATVLAIGFFPPLFGFSLIEMRWWYLAQCFMAVPLAGALVYLTQGNKYGVIVVSILVAAVVFLNTIGLMSNLTQRALSPNQIVRYGLTDKEMVGLNVAESFNPKKIGSDSYYTSYIQSKEKWLGKLEGLEDHIFSGDFRDCESDVLILRDSLYKEPFGYGGGTIYKLEFNPADIAAKQGYQLVYSNGDVQCLIRK